MPNIVETIELIESFKDLPTGWNFGVGEPIAQYPLERSKSVLAVAHVLGLNEADAFPGSDGEIQINFYNDESTLELMFGSNGQIAATLDDGESCVSLADDSSLKDIYKLLKEFQYNKCRTFASSISRGTTISSGNVLQVSHFNPQVMAAYQWSVRNAAKSTAVRYVPTLRNTTRVPQAHRSYSGKFRPTMFQPDAQLSKV